MLANLYLLGFWLLQEAPAVGGWDLREMWALMGWPARVVVIMLFIMSAWSVGVMIDRGITYSAARKQSRYFVQAVAGALREGKLDEAIRIAERNKKSHIAKVVASGLADFQASAGLPEDDIIEAALEVGVGDGHHRRHRSLRRAVRHRSRHHQRLPPNPDPE